MLKQFYDCPLSAAYMMKHYKVRVTHNGETLTLNDLKNMPWEAKCRLYVHPEDTHIIELYKSKPFFIPKITNTELP